MSGKDEKSVYRSEEKETDINKDFIKETLKTFINFHITEINKKWFQSRFSKWVQLRRDAGENIQLAGAADAGEFISSFYSKNTGSFFDQKTFDALKKIIPAKARGNYFIWDIGCGNGYETYSVAAIVKQQNPDAAIKIWANDKDLLSISNAPNLTITADSVPPYLKAYVTEGTKGGVISQELKDIIYFEYHDVKNHNPYPDVDLIICRDVLSFFDYNEQFRITSEFYDKLKNSGILIIGDNEIIDFDGFEEKEESGIVYYRKNEGRK